MPAKTEQLQIRVTPQQKAGLKRLARAAGLDVSAYVLAKALPDPADRFVELLRLLQSDADRRFVLAELSDFLHTCPPFAFGEAVSRADLTRLSSFWQNYVAAMVEHAATAKLVAPPAWVRDVTPLETPSFATRLQSVRLHLLRASPVPFKRRNIFIDASVGDRV